MNNESDYKDGFEAGQAWAKKAKSKRLDALVNYIKQSEEENSPWYDMDWSGWDAPFSAADNLAFAVRPDDDREQDKADWFWREEVGIGSEDDEDIAPTSDFLHGFGDGAVKVWKAI